MEMKEFGVYMLMLALAVALVLLALFVVERVGG